MAHRPGTWPAFLTGVLCANSTPHLVTAAKGEVMLTPLGGHDSGPVANLVWGLVNVAAGAALGARAGERLASPAAGVLPFAAGAGAFALWAVAYRSLVAAE